MVRPPTLTGSTAALLLVAVLGGCNMGTRLSQIGDMPPLTTIQNPQAQPGYQPVSLPMPHPIVGERRPNSLWQSGSRAFFKDQRASQIGDILTVIVNFDDKATLHNNTETQKTTQDNVAAPHLLGFEGQLQKVLPSKADPTNLLSVSGGNDNKGQFSVDREENITLQVAALVTQVLPNGNLVVQGRQEFRVNYEVRDLQITGVLRPQDISSTNTVALEKLAEARVSYGGRGQGTYNQQPRYGEQLIDIFSPF